MDEKPTTRSQRDCARIRCLVVAINALHCEIARVIQASDDPEKLDEYADLNFAKGNEDDKFVGLSMDDLVDLLGPLSAIEKLVAMGNASEAMRIVKLNRTEANASMYDDLILYLEGIVRDRPPEPDDETSN